MKFNSQICTTREQSERLLSLGLKKETADMLIMSYSTKQDIIVLPWSESGGWTRDNSIPAWSLHRLIEMCPDYIEETYFGVSAMDVSYYFGLCEGRIGYRFVKEGGNLYDNLIDCIEWLIKEGYFNKEYLV